MSGGWGQGLEGAEVGTGRGMRPARQKAQGLAVPREGSGAAATQQSPRECAGERGRGGQGPRAGTPGNWAPWTQLP